MTHRKRPTAFEVSFPGETTLLEDDSTGTSDIEYRKRAWDIAGHNGARVRIQHLMHVVPLY